ncbi:hypothetical protein [Streptomyces sp. NBC_01396]|uniref:hypothetical protein n=1 Tax=Streptomyces sp. NBC_01396 TaxID=2903852 RepID=UPI0032504F08
MPEEHEEPKTSAEKIDTLFHVVRWPNREQFSNEEVANFSVQIHRLVADPLAVEAPTRTRYGTFERSLSFTDLRAALNSRGVELVEIPPPDRASTNTGDRIPRLSYWSTTMLAAR